MATQAELPALQLPTYLTRFVGRDSELSVVLARLKPQQVLTVTGLGGAGKTRLAIEAARRWQRIRAGRVVWVSLVDVCEPEQVPVAVASAMGLEGLAAVQTAEDLVVPLADAPVLLVLDNCQHVSSGCQAMLSLLLAGCPLLAVLATSQAPLGLEEERTYALPPLGAVGRPGSRGRSEATDLFLDRVGRSSPGYPVDVANDGPIQELCARLGGLPLAIELAASWIDVLSPRDLVRQIDDALGFLTSRSHLVADRHRSMLRVLDYSWQQLVDAEQAALANLSPFIGGFTREAAESVAGAGLSVLASLASRALLHRSPDTGAGSRFHLHELVRTYAGAQLEAQGPAAANRVRGHHFDYFLQLAEGAEISWLTPVEPDGRNPLLIEQGNVDSALLWAIGRGDAARALQMSVPLNAFWASSVPSRAVRRARMSRVLALSWPAADAGVARLRARALSILGYLQLHDRLVSDQLFAESQELFSRAEDHAGVASCLRARGDLAMAAGEIGECRRLELEALPMAQAAGDGQGVAWSMFDLGRAALAADDLSDARSLLTEAAQRFEGFASPLGVCWAGTLLAETYRREGRWTAALDAYRSTLHVQRAHGFTVLIADVLEGLALVAAELNRLDLSAHLSGAGAAWRVAHEVGRDRCLQGPLAQAVSQGRQQLGEEAWTAAVAAGRQLVPEQAVRLTERSMRELVAPAAARPSRLTEREIDVLALVVQGVSNATIANRLDVSVRTVHAHLRSIFDKLGVGSRTAAAHQAIRLNVIPPPFGDLQPDRR